MKTAIQNNNYEFSVYNAPIYNTTPLGIYNLKDVYKTITSDKYKDVTTDLRSKTFKKDRSAIKTNLLDYVTFSGTFNKREDKGLIQHSNLFSLDIDNLSSTVNLEDVKSDIIEYLPPSLIFVSPSGNGLKVVYKITITDETTHQQYFDAFKNFYSNQLNIEIDESCPDVPRACFLCNDKDAYFNNGVEPLDKSFIDTFYIDEEIENSFKAVEHSQEKLKDSSINGLTCWDDFNNRNDILNVISNELEVVKEDSEKYAIKRFGSDAEHSGYIFKDNKLMYLFSDNTCYNSRESYTSFTAYCKKNNLTLSEGAKDIYSQGYGDRITTGKEDTKKTSIIPIESLPEYIQSFINEYTEVYRVPRDYITASVIFSTALAIGNKMELKGKYDNIPLLWLALVGNVSSGKTDPLKQCLSYFTQADSNSFNDYNLKRSEFEQFDSLSKADKQKADPIDKPTYFQYLLNDYTPESLYNAHTVNDRGLCIYRDELKGWLDDFDRYSKSGEQSTMLSTFYRQPLAINRASKDPININQPTVYVAGGIQPEILKDLANDNRAENGFLSRIIFVYPDLDEKQPYSDETLNPETLNNYHVYLNAFATIETPINLTLSKDAKSLYKNWYNKNVELSNKEPKGYLKGVYGKLDVISLRLAIVVQGMDYVCNQNTSIEITPESMKTALELTEYFRETALKVYKKAFSNEVPNYKKKDVAKYLNEFGASQVDIAKILNVTQPYISKAIK